MQQVRTAPREEELERFEIIAITAVILLFKWDTHAVAAVTDLQDQISPNGGVRMRAGLTQHECNK